jgi:hypothetical protein
MHELDIFLGAGAICVGIAALASLRHHVPACRAARQSLQAGSFFHRGHRYWIDAIQLQTRSSVYTGLAGLANAKVRYSEQGLEPADSSMPLQLMAATVRKLQPAWFCVEFQAIEHQSTLVPLQHNGRMSWQFQTSTVYRDLSKCGVTLALPLESSIKLRLPALPMLQYTEWQEMSAPRRARLGYWPLGAPLHLLLSDSVADQSAVLEVAGAGAQGAALPCVHACGTRESVAEAVYALNGASQAAVVGAVAVLLLEAALAGVLALQWLQSRPAAPVVSPAAPLPLPLPPPPVNPNEIGPVADDSSGWVCPEDNQGRIKQGQ